MKRRQPAREDARAETKEAWSEGGHTAVFVTYDQEETVVLADALRSFTEAAYLRASRRLWYARACKRASSRKGRMSVLSGYWFQEWRLSWVKSRKA